jgi:hypothetical protein
VLTIVGGLFILLGGSLLAVLGIVFALIGFVSGLFFLGLLVGGLTLLVGILMLAFPSGHVTWGVLAIVLAVVSIPFALGGLIIGFLLTLLGGILALAWKPPQEPAVTVGARPVPPPTG